MHNTNTNSLKEENAKVTTVDQVMGIRVDQVMVIRVDQVMGIRVDHSPPGLAVDAPAGASVSVLHGVVGAPEGPLHTLDPARSKTLPPLGPGGPPTMHCGGTQGMESGLSRGALLCGPQRSSLNVLSLVIKRWTGFMIKCKP